MSSIVVERVGSVGYLTLSQPASLNALTQVMVDALREGLQQHENNSDVHVVVLRSASERAFCAGGDMKQIRQLALDGNTQAIEHFFTQEYALNLAIATSEKPYVSLIDGVAMGGGLGLSVHGKFRIATERALMAMPESRIGFFPDVGGSYFLQHLPLNCGTWLALTATAVRAQQTVSTGLATHFVSHDELPALVQQLENIHLSTTENATETAFKLVQQLLDKANTFSTDAEFTARLEQRAQWFEGYDVEAIKNQLQAAQNNEDAVALLAKINSGSPHSYAITLSLFKRTHGLSLQQCLDEELTLAKEACTHPDLAEGVRAVLVDKDHKPQWR